MRKSFFIFVIIIVAVLLGIHPVYAQDETVGTRLAAAHQLALLASTLPPAPESIIYDFVNSSMDGHYPASNLISDAAGNLYGTTERGGTTAGGTVYELSPLSGGAWTYTELHAFHSSKTDGKNPYNGVTFDGAGNLYGTTDTGGLYGYGVVFELSPQSGGGWSYQVIHNFQGSGFIKDGYSPKGPLAFDAAGNLYGTTFGGGTGGSCYSGGCGIVYMLSPLKTGGWVEKVIYNFLGSPDGSSPASGVVIDASGNLYGTTTSGGTLGFGCGTFIPGCGTVFELEHASDGGWAEGVLYAFKNNLRDGTGPSGALIFDGAGNLYGTAPYGGVCHDSDCGAVFELSPKSGGGWSEKVLYDFQNNGTDGLNPEGNLVFDAAGTLYGTTNLGGTHNLGSVFQLTPKSSGKWSEKVLHSFKNGTTDGQNPTSGLAIDSSGNLYGATSTGGATGGGVVFEVTPQ
jgi:uncharacterized repeat protein (TIGR03803 family)